MTTPERAITTAERSMTAAELAKERARNGPAIAAHGGEADIKHEPQPTGHASVNALPPAVATAARYGVPFRQFIGEEEPGNDPADVFEVHGLIVRAEPGLLLGPPKIGKTMCVEDLMLHVAAGRREWCGVPIYRRCRVLLFLREDSERTTIRRLWQLRAPCWPGRTLPRSGLGGAGTARCSTSIRGSMIHLQLRDGGRVQRAPSRLEIWRRLLA